MLNWLERRFGRYGIPNLTLILIAGQVAAMAAGSADPKLLEQLVLIPNKVIDGEYYLLLSFLVMPPGMSPIWAFFFWYMFYLMGTALEHYWGTFRYNVFLLIGVVATIGASFFAPDQPVGNWFLKGGVFLAFAYLNPTFTIHIFFVLPVQIRWSAMLTWIGFAVGFIGGTWSTKLSIAASVFNFLVFFGPQIIHRARHGGRHMTRQAQRFGQRPPDYIHKCQICGLTDSDDRHMDFRYCGQCTGDLCYCSVHLKDHTHVVVESDAQA